MARFARCFWIVPMAAFVAAAGGVAKAQTQAQIPGQGADPTNAAIFMPYPDGDPKNPQRFRKPKFGNPPGSGAGTTGFDSTNIKGNKKLAKPPVAPPPLPPLAPSDQTVAPIYRETGCGASAADHAGHASPAIRTVCSNGHRPFGVGRSMKIRSGRSVFATALYLEARRGAHRRL